MTEKPEAVRRAEEVISAYMGSFDPNTGEHRRGVFDLVNAFKDAARRCAETGAKFILVAVSAPDLPAIDGLEKCALWAQQASKSKGKTNG